MRSPLNSQNGKLYFDNVPCDDLAGTYGTPLYVISESMIQDRLDEIKRDFLQKYPHTRAVYACKAYQTLDMCRLVTKNGLGLDVVSGGELYTALKAGADPSQIYFHGNAKSEEELTQAVTCGVGRIVVDNFDELEMLAEIGEKIGFTGKRGEPVPILFRITPGVDSHTHAYISTAGLDSKFGIPLEPAERKRYVDRAVESPYIDLKGFHFHVGSQLFENNSHIMALEILVNLMAELKNQVPFVTREINLGGGFGVNYTKDDKAPKIQEFTGPMMGTLDRLCTEKGLVRPVVTIEPGRWIIAEAGATLYTINSVKKIPGVKTWVSVDGGMGDNLRPALYQAKYECALTDRPEVPGDTPCDIAGKYCESGDVLLRGACLPAPKRGDILAFYTTGAYGFSMFSGYNRNRRPAVVAVDGSNHRLTVKRQSYEDLISLDC